jgi:ribosomal protein S18 acetylase RimI-like enzyme
MTQIIFRALQNSSDCQLISRAFNSQGWDKPVLLYEKYLEEQQQASRDSIIALFDGEFAGYVTIKWSSCYQSFLQNGVAEISDLNVLERYQRNGIGSALVLEAERRISKRAVAAGIGVGLTPDYGPALRLYWKLGFKPDGLGLTYNNERCQYGSQVRVDDDLVLWLIKSV